MGRKERKVALNRIERIVSRISYKRGWKFNVVPRRYTNLAGDSTIWEHGKFTVTIVAPMDNLNWPGTKFDVGLGVDVSEESEEELIVRQILLGVKRLEEHEVKEWFKLDGKNVEEPHPELLERE